MNDRLYRSSTDRSLTGVAGGLAAYLGIDPSIVRVAWVLAAIVTGGLAALVYLVMVFVVPEAPPGWTGRGAGPTSWTSPSGDAEGAGAAAWGRPPATADTPAKPAGAGNAGIVLGAILILLGTWFLVRQYVRIDWDIVWPVIVIGLGALLIAGAMRRRA